MTDLQVIGAHFGNLCVDGSSSLGFLSADKARELIGLYGAECVHRLQ